MLWWAENSLGYTSNSSQKCRSRAAALQSSSVVHYWKKEGQTRSARARAAEAVSSAALVGEEELFFNHHQLGLATKEVTRLAVATNAAASPSGTSVVVLVVQH